MTVNVLASEKVAVVGTIDPQTVTSTAKYTDVVDMSKFRQALFVFALGDMAAETIDASVEYCDSAGSNNAALKSATQLAAHASNNDNKQIVIGVRAEDLLASGYRYCRGKLVTGDTTGGAACCIALGVDPVYGPASDNDLASVAEIEDDLD